MKKSELRKQIEELQEEQKSLLLDLRDIVMEKDFFKANGVKFRWRTKFELEDIFYDGKPMAFSGTRTMQGIYPYMLNKKEERTFPGKSEPIDFKPESPSKEAEEIQSELDKKEHINNPLKGVTIEWRGKIVDEPSKPAEMENYKWTESLISKLALFVLETSDSEKYETLDEVISVFKINNPSPAEEKVDFSVAKAVNILTDALNADPDFRETYKANIAMMFYDEYLKQFPECTWEVPKIHEIANKAADRFLNHWCQENKKPPVEEKGYAESEPSWLKDFIAGLKKADPNPVNEYLRKAGFIHDEAPAMVMRPRTEPFGSLGFDLLSGNIIWGSGAFGVELGVEHNVGDEQAKKYQESRKKEVQKKYPEGILSFKKADGTFGYHIEKLTIIPYQEWCEYHLESKPVASIHSVKNSKGEVFQKGDFIYLLSPQTGQQGLIESFEVCGDEGERFIAIDLKKEGGTQRIKIDSITKIYPDGIPKAEKPQPNKYPEGILSFKDGNAIFKRVFSNPVTYNQWVEAYMRLNIPIYSVKNSKGEVFTVGDWFSSPFVRGDKKIESIKIFGSVEPVILVTYDRTYEINIEVATAISKKGPSWKDQIVAFKAIYSKTIYTRQSDGTFISPPPAGLSFQLHHMLDKPDQYEIFTVKNSAGVEFSVGDEVYNEGTNDKFTINGFRQSIGLRDDLMAYETKGIIYCIDFLVKVKAEPKKEPKPLFKTEDGVNIFEGDEYFAVRKSDFNISEYTALFAKYLVDEDYYTRFKHKSNAERFVAENRKSISYKELNQFCSNIANTYWSIPKDGDVFRRVVIHTKCVSNEEILNFFKPKS